MSSSSSADALARRLLGVAPVAAPGEGAELDGVSMRAAERGLADVADTLGRWFGPYGYHALLTRALVSARVAHPALAPVQVRAPLEPVLDGLSDAAARAGVSPVVGLVAMVATMIDLLGRMVGADMARHLLERGKERPTANGLDQSEHPGTVSTSQRMP